MNTVTSIQPKSIKRGGQVHQQENTNGTYNADVTPRQSIRIHGVQTNNVHGPQVFDKTFNIGDQAEYDSWNIKYIGRIIAIGPKTVTVKHYPTSKEVTMLDLYEFVRHNWNFNIEAAERHNAEELQCL